ncbi:MAG TPA: MBL fold metallo-hydrolase [Candidatus Cottocaccamicrobium excrementipullorum]|nr:MBL fold metallo-hydrolase [Candidatus Cottocaccamicrobium excrementipullorum]
MSMNRLIIKGGYGEHGRSCFLLSFGENRYYMLDCGIMDTDPNPFPQVEPALLKQTRYLFLSHCHKDHSGAFEEFCRQGFNGWLVTTRPTLEFSGILWDKTILLDCPSNPDQGRKGLSLEDGLSFSYGKSGHCAGSLWFHFRDPYGSVLYTGDYQKRPLVYQTDPIEGRKADLAIMDCAHSKEQGDAPELRGQMIRQIQNLLKEGRKILMPLPKYGRGVEIIYMLRESLPEAKIAMDQNMIRLTEKTLAFPQWLKPKAVQDIQAFLAGQPDKGLDSGEYDILLLGDTHLEQPESIQLALQATSKGAAVLLTGRVKTGCLTETLLAEGKAFTMAYPHHQSRGDFLEMAHENQFQVMLPFHNPEKEVFWNSFSCSLKKS